MKAEWIHSALASSLDWVSSARTLNQDWLRSPLVPYVLCCMCLGGSLLLWVLFKKEVGRIRSLTKKSYDILNANVKDLSSAMYTIRDTWRPMEPAPSLQPSYRGLDLTRRTEVLRMHSRNEPVTSIAAELLVPQNEIELLLRIDRAMKHGKS